MVPDPLLLAGYAAAALVLVLGLVLVAGHLPPRGRPAGQALVWLNLLLLVVLLLALGALAIGRLAWPVAVIAGGLTLLAGPLVFQALPRAWRDGGVGLAGQAALSGLALLLLLPLLRA